MDGVLCDVVCTGRFYNNAEFGATWLHSYVTPDRKRSFCIYDGPSRRSSLPKSGHACMS